MLDLADQPRGGTAAGGVEQTVLVRVCTLISEPYFEVQGGPGDLFGNVVDVNGQVHALVRVPGLLHGTNSSTAMTTTGKRDGIPHIDRERGISRCFLAESPRNELPHCSVGWRPSPQYPTNYSGRLDELAIYNRALSATEIQAIHKVGASGRCWPPVAPQIVHQPMDQKVWVGRSVAFEVAATGGEPLRYQWKFNGSTMPGETTAFLTIGNAVPAAAGSYSVEVSNLWRSVISSNATLTVLTDCLETPSGLVSWFAGEGKCLRLWVSTNHGVMSPTVVFAGGMVDRAFEFVLGIPCGDCTLG